MWQDIFSNKCIYVPILLWLCLQIFKFVSDFLINKKPNFKRLFGAGGMPSSHSTIVTSLAVLIGREYGFDSGVFALSIIFAFVVMYDSAGVRRAAGKQAALLNKIVETPGLKIGEVQERLVEVLGHTPFQVFVGAIIGIAVGAIV